MDVEVFLGGMCTDLDPQAPGSRHGHFYGRARIGIMTPEQARELYEDLFTTGYGTNEELIMGGIRVDRFVVRVPGGEFHHDYGRCPYCTKREDCHAWTLGDEILYLPHTRFYRDGEQDDPRWTDGHNWRMCEGSLVSWTSRSAAAHRAQAKARKQGQGLLEAFGVTT